ncbi:MAG: hypothetical protein ACE5I5_02165 [Candidatus Heimdallarchaeota archaeon]
MRITSREDALSAPVTPKSKLRAFERRLYDLHACSLHELLQYLTDEQAEFMISTEAGVVVMGIQALLTGNINLNTMRYLGDPLGCNFQFRKVAKRASRIMTPLPQRFHGRVFLSDYKIVVVIETEIDPLDTLSGILHLSERTEHRIIRLHRK